MRIALVNPPWTFEGSIYFGCREPHLPLEYGYARSLLSRAGHETSIVDAQLLGLTLSDVRSRVERFAPDMIVVTTAPSYLFWRCAPPELKVPLQTFRAFSDIDAWKVVVGPHASTTPGSTLRKTRADVAVLGECEDVLVELASTPSDQWRELQSIAYLDSERELKVQGKPRATNMQRLSALRWEKELLTRHAHHHHRFDNGVEGLGAEVETSRGCPYHCTFCAKENFRDMFRRRAVPTVLEEIDALIAQGVQYVYFVDEIFLPHKALLLGLKDRPIRFGVQLRIDNWDRSMLELLGEAGCVSIEAGVESITRRGRSLLQKNCKLSTDELESLLVYAKQHVAFVQANLIDNQEDDPELVREFRSRLHSRGVWANEPVPMFLYPGSPGYRMKWGMPDDDAWERAVADYLERFAAFSDIQDSSPRRLMELEASAPV